MLEVLEDRLTPSTVTEYAPDVATLQADLASATAANTQYIINLTGTNSAYNLAAGQQLTVSAAASGSSVTIAGNGQTVTGNENRVFLIDAGANATIEDVTITGGTITGNIASGGGIDDAGGQVTLSNVIVKNNTATGGSANGGGLYVSGGQLTIAHSTFQGNSVMGNAGASAGASGGAAEGGAVYATGSSTVTIRDSIISGNIAQGGNGANGTSGNPLNVNGGSGGDAIGGGLFVNGSGWNVTLTGDTLSGNSAISGNGGNGVAGGNGGSSGDAQGGAVDIIGSGTGLTILNDLDRPIDHPSLLVDNRVKSGNGGTGGKAGVASSAEGGAVFLSAPGATVSIGNTTLYGNKAIGPNNAVGGGMDFRNGNFTMVNSTVAQNTGQGNNLIFGGGIADNDPQSVTFANDTITQNTVSGTTNLGAGLSLDPQASNPTLLNNILIGNQGVGGAAVDLDVTGGQSLANANNNFLGSFSLWGLNHYPQGGINPPNVVNTTNIVGSTQIQVGNVVGVDANGKPSGGPIYYPLLPGTASVGGGTTSALSAIAAVEGQPATLTDEIGNAILPSNPLALGAVQFMPAHAKVTFTNWHLSMFTVSNQPLTETITVHLENVLGASIDGGTVVFTLMATDGTVLTSSSPESVRNGSVSGSLTIPANLAAGNYTLQAVYTTTSGQVLTDSPGSINLFLTINPTPPPPAPSPPPPAPSPPPPSPPSSPPIPFLNAAITLYIDGYEKILQGDSAALEQSIQTNLPYAVFDGYNLGNLLVLAGEFDAYSAEHGKGGNV